MKKFFMLAVLAVASFSLGCTQEAATTGTDAGGETTTETTTDAETDAAE